MSLLKKSKASKLSRLGADQNEDAASRLSVLLWVDTKFLHSRKERCAINAKLRGSSISTPDAPFGRGKRAYNFVALLLCIFLSNPVLVISPVGIVSKDMVVLFEDWVLGFIRVRLL
jgi:hypothetical protein